MQGKIPLNTFLSILVVMLAISNANYCLKKPLVDYSFVYLVQLFFIGLVFIYKKNLCPGTSDYKWLNRFLIWCFIEIVSGLLVASNYIEYRQLFVGGISLMVPILAWVFYEPIRFSKIFHFFYRYAWIPYLVFFVWTLGLTQFYYYPLLILFLLFSLFPKKQRVVILVLAFVYVASVWGDARSQSYKGMSALLFGFLLMYRHRMPAKVFRIIRVACFFCTLVLFAFVLTDSFQVIVKGVNVKMIEENNLERTGGNKDTRSLLYIDIYQSSIANGVKTILFGKTPARGFEIKYSGLLFVSQYKDNFVFNKGERHKNEMVLSNIYVWTGLLGLFLFSMIYFRGSSLAVNCSRNKILPVVGCFIAFRWTYGWVEDVNNFLIMDVDLWALIGMCYSDKFRKMSEDEIVVWAKGLLNSKYRRLTVDG